MKAPIRRPLKRHFVAVLPLLIISGCSGVQNNTVYQSWEKRAYDAYNIAAPSTKDMNVLPALLRTVALPGRQFIRNPSVQRVSYRKSVNNSKHTSVMSSQSSRNELDYIEQNYGL